MNAPPRPGKGPPINEQALEAALNRLLGGGVAEVLRASILQKVRQEGTADPDRLLQGIEDLNPWLGALLRRAAAEPRDSDLQGGRTQNNTTARKGEK